MHAIVSAAGFRKLRTRLFDAENTYLYSDVVFEVKSSLIREFKRNASPDATEKLGVHRPFWELANDFLLTCIG